MRRLGSTLLFVMVCFSVRGSVRLGGAAQKRRPGRQNARCRLRADAHDVVDKMLELANVHGRRGLRSGGDGRIVVTAAKKYGCRAVGYEIDPEQVAQSQKNIQKAGVGRLAQVKQQDIFTLDLRPASVVTLYLLPGLNVKLIPQLQDLKPGSRVVTHDFDIDGIRPIGVRFTSKEDELKHTIYVHQECAAVGRAWPSLGELSAVCGAGAWRGPSLQTIGFCLARPSVLVPVPRTIFRHRLLKKQGTGRKRPVPLEIHPTASRAARLRGSCRPCGPGRPCGSCNPTRCRTS